MSRKNAHRFEMARAARKHFTKSYRSPEAGGEAYWHTKEDAPDWLQEMCRQAHDKMLPDDWRYSFIVDALDELISYDGDREEACSYLDADCSNAELLNWLASRNSRYAYVDEAIGEFGHGESVIDDIGRGQLQEKLEVFHAVADYLEELDEEAASA